MSKQTLTESINNAIEGLTYAFRTQRNLRIHVGLGILALVLSMFLGMNRLELLVLILTISFVIVVEMFNTVVELVINMIEDQVHPVARSAKDVAAGCVLLAAVAAICVGYLLFVDRFKEFLGGSIERMRFTPWHISFMAVFIVLTLVIVIKLLFHRGSPLLGGMPSGHAAFAFSLWTLVALFQSNLLVTTIVLVMTLLVARHRVKMGYHSFWEAVAGACLGILVTLFVTKLLGT